MVFRIQNLGLALFGLLLLGACTRTPVQKTSFQIELPSDLGAHKVGAMTVDPSTLQHLIINVTGTGISNPVYYSWDSNQGSVTPPTSFTIDVPQGTGRLVQVLAVYRDSGKQGFYYGDIAGLSTTSANSTATVSVALISADLGEGNIAGRYLTGNNEGPTGKITTMYKPTGKPPMIIEQSEIIGGYFRVFALKGAKFDYVLPNGTSLFGAPVDVDLNNNAGLQAHATQITLDPYWEEQEDGSRFELEESRLTFGWFSSPAASSYLMSKSICYINQGSATFNEIERAYTGSSGPDLLSWDIDAFVETGDWLNNAQSEDPDELLCAGSGIRYEDYFSIDHQALVSRDSTMALRGAFVLNSTDSGGSSYREGFKVSMGPAGLRMRWEYLPGTVTSGAYKALDGVDVFWRARLTPDDGHDEEYRDDGYNCAGLGAYGFQHLRNQPSNSADLTEDVKMTTLPAGFANAFDEGRIDLVMCPYTSGSASKNYFRSGLSFHSWLGGSPATEIEMLKLSGDTNPGFYAYNNTCTPFLVRGKDGHLNNLDAIFTYSSGNLGASDDADCPSPMSTGNSFRRLADGYIVYIKHTGTGAVTESVSISDNTGMFADLDIDFNLDDAGSQAEEALVLVPTAIKAHSCYSANILIRDSNNGSAVLPMASLNNRFFGWPKSSSMEFFYGSDPNCLGTAQTSPQTTIYSGQAMSETQLYFKYKGTSSTVSLTPVVDSGAGITFQGVNTTVTQPGAPKSLTILTTSGGLMGSSCNTIYVSPRDMSGFRTPATANINVTFTSSDASNTEFYEADGANYCTCGTPQEILGPVTVASGTAAKKFCLKTLNNNFNVGVSVSGTLNGTSISGENHFYVGGP